MLGASMKRVETTPASKRPITEDRLRRRRSSSNAFGAPDMSRNLLMQSILGHLSLLERKYPKKAATPVARRVKRYARQSIQTPRQRAA